MKYGDLIGSVIYMLTGFFVWWNVFKAVRVQRKHIEELERTIQQQNQRQVGFLAIFEMLLRKLNDTTTAKRD